MADTTLPTKPRDWKYQIGFSHHWLWWVCGLGLTFQREPDKATHGWLLHGQLLWFWFCLSCYHIYAWPGKGRNY